MSLIKKVHDIMAEQNETFIERAEVILGTWMSLITAQHAFLLGPPGVGKSMVLNDVMRRITGAKLFTYLMSKDSTRSELFGPPDLKALENGQYKFITTGRAAEAHALFLDEIWKASSYIRNTMLTLVNERWFDNGGIRQDAPLVSLFAASNELPEGDEDQAMYDRFLFRYQVTPLESQADFRDLMILEPELNGNPTQLSLDELLQLQKEAKGVKVPDSVLDKIVGIRARLQAEAGITLSDRRWLQAKKALRAHALLNERDEATDDDLEVMQHVVWDDPAHRAKTARIVLQTVNPVYSQLLDLLDQAREVDQNVKDDLVKAATDEEAANALGLRMSEAHNKLRKITRKLSELPSSERKTKIQKEIAGYMDHVVRQGLLTTGS